MADKVITAGAWVALRSWSDSAEMPLHMLAKAQVALDAGITLDELLDAPLREYSAQVTDMLVAGTEQISAAEPERVDLPDGVQFGDIALREPTGRDYNLLNTNVPRALMATIAKCADMDIADIERLPFNEYRHMEAWMGEAAGLGGTA